MNVKSSINFQCLKPLGLIVSLLMLMLPLGNCFWIKARYDPEGFQYAVTIQKEALELLSKANEPFYYHKKKVYQVLSKVESAYDHARVRTKNKSVTAIWDVQRNPYANRFSFFMEEWRTEGILGEKKIATYKKWLVEDFKLLIQLEENKKK